MQSDGLPPITFHYRVAISACASLGYGGRAATLLLGMQNEGMPFMSAAADAMFACNRAGMPDVALDIFEAVRGACAAAASAEASGVEVEDHMTAWRRRFVFNGALDAHKRLKDPASAVELLLSMQSEHGATRRVLVQHCTLGVP